MGVTLSSKQLRLLLISPFLLLASVLNSACTTITVSGDNLMQGTGEARLHREVPEDYSLQEFRFDRPDGSDAYGIAVTRPENSKAILYFGGNQFYIDRAGFWAVKTLAPLGVDIYIVDRRGYGRSPGVPTVNIIEADAITAYDQVASMTDKPLVVHGHSLGGYEAAAVAREREVDALVLEATATNVDAWADTLVPWYASPFITVDIQDELRKFDNAEAVRKHQGPLLLLAGGDDKQVDKSLLEDLYAASTVEQKALVTVAEADHGDILTFEKALDAYRILLGQVPAQD